MSVTGIEDIANLIPGDKVLVTLASTEREHKRWMAHGGHELNEVGSATRCSVIEYEPITGKKPHYNIWSTNINHLDFEGNSLNFNEQHRNYQRIEPTDAVYTKLTAILDRSPR
ncbi:hypothetical protein HYV86_01895 [Candidatus Woesearchaeota archaeon]|nr:hypothetical protein [Candidatus Woesearchaeota archaeon]